MIQNQTTKNPKEFEQKVTSLRLQTQFKIHVRSQITGLMTIEKSKYSKTSLSAKDCLKKISALNEFALNEVS